jgi:hypothetical protein
MNLSFTKDAKAANSLNHSHVTSNPHLKSNYLTYSNAFRTEVMYADSFKDFNVNSSFGHHTDPHLTALNMNDNAR